MSVIEAIKTESAERRTVTDIARDLGFGFEQRAMETTDEDEFVADNFALLKTSGLFEAGVPAELGGGGATHRELCAMVRTLARHCGSTGLAFSMHTHLIGMLAYLWRSGNTAPEPLLRRVAAENLVLISSGGSDWLNGSGTLEKVDGGFRFTGRKVFSSGVPAGDILMTTGVYDDPENGPTVYHFPLPLKNDAVRILDTWRTLGMRGTGSNDVEITDIFLPDAVMQGVRRPAGKWHPSVHAVALVALPIFNAAYLGVAEKAREIALRLAARRKDDPLCAVLAGEMENEIVNAQVVHESMIEMTATAKPGPETTVAMMCRRTLLGRSVLAAVEKALELGGGAGFYRAAGLERCFRDVQGVRYHPMPEKPQLLQAGRHALGLAFE
jgi:alkylation response protein AidB-like acyl-CoA dehydrogenase